jgi:hypothetical protein
MDDARRVAANIAKLPNYLAANPDFDALTFYGAELWLMMTW